MLLECADLMPSLDIIYAGPYMAKDMVPRFGESTIPRPIVD